MAPNLPMCCASRGFDLLKRQLSVLDSSDALLNGSIAIAMHQIEDIDPAEIDAQLQSYVDRVRSRVRGRQTQATLAHLHDVLFDQEGYRGNTEDYYSTLNSYLPAVLQTKRGLPITLSLIYKLVAERLGLRASGIGLPGHFLVSVEADGGQLLVDPFAGGRILTIDEAQARHVEMFGEEAEWSDDLLRPASNRHWLTRMLQNLLNVFSSAGQYNDVAAVLEMEILLWPEQVHLQRDLGLVLARCGLSEQASIWLDRYLQTNPDDPQNTQLKELLSVLIG